jgi:hypothetical protein
VVSDGGGDEGVDDGLREDPFTGDELAAGEHGHLRYFGVRRRDGAHP